jgi:hypothetical protein
MLLLRKPVNAANLITLNADDPFAHWIFCYMVGLLIMLFGEAFMVPLTFIISTVFLTGLQTANDISAIILQLCSCLSFVAGIALAIPTIKEKWDKMLKHKKKKKEDE